MHHKNVLHKINSYFVLMDGDLSWLNDFDGFLFRLGCYYYALYFGAKPRAAYLQEQWGAVFLPLIGQPSTENDQLL